MNRGVLEVENLIMSTGNVNGGLKPPPPFPLPLPAASTYLPNFFASPSCSSSSSSSSSSPSLPPSNPNLMNSSFFDNRDLPLDQPWSLSQLLLGGLMMGEEERLEMMMMMMNNHQQHSSYSQEKKLEDWEEQVLMRHQQASILKQESNYYNHNHNGNYVIMSSPNKSTTIQNINQDLNNNNNNNNGLNNLSESNNSSEFGGSCSSSSMANKKPKLQLSSSHHHLPSSQTTLKVRKEKLGGRIAALHQLVSPFGKTDTASVLSEAIGYIRFLHSQVEALSLPYFGTPSRNKMTQQHAQGDMNGIFPEDPGQLLNEYYMKRTKGGSSTEKNQESNPNEEPKTKDLRSRGLCLVPISCTLQVGSDNGADYWAPAFGISFR